jgi:AcrR family transcriptional regulator
MARPRKYEVDDLLDAAEILLAGGERSAFSIRTLAEATGAPTGTLYHAFGSSADLLGRLWLRAAREFLALQKARVTGVDESETDAKILCVLAAAGTLEEFKELRPAAAAVLINYRREMLIGEGLSEELAVELRGLDESLSGLIGTLSQRMWGRGDRSAREAIAACVVNLPGALLVDQRLSRPAAARLLELAVRGILSEEPSPHKAR